MDQNIKQEFKEGVPSKRTAIIKPTVNYTIYGIFYVDPWLNKNTTATVSAENSEEAIGLLEKSLNGMGEMITKNDLNAVAEDTGYKTSKKGMIYGYDSFSRSMFD